ncbi:MAG TPA: DUF692 family protein [Kofleriaceae bacterium]|nr:DUF692 family protein [Kofleriaceae bacterium]
MSDQVGIGLQVNPTVLELQPQGVDPSLYDYAELLCDQFTGPLDAGFVLDPVMRPLLDEVAARHPLIAHGNYGNEFGFEPLDETPGVLRHIAAAHAMKSPWYADHMFFGFQAPSYVWSSPLPFSRAEAERVAGRAAALQDRLKLPLLHENAFYYARMPGSELAEAEFIAAMVEKAQTHLLLDLHNIYSNSKNFEGYDPWTFLRTVPLDRVLEIHIAGGQQSDGWYHDFHSYPVPEPVWEMLAYVVARARNLRAIVLEVQGPAHSHVSRPVDPSWVPMINGDLRRARAVLNENRAPAASAR